MGANTPLWVALLGGALGGALINNLITLGIRWLDRRHRHDETRRDHYVSVQTAFLEYFEAVNQAITLHNNRMADMASGPVQTYASRNSAQEKRHKEAHEGVEEKYLTAHRAWNTLLLFAPERVAAPLNRVLTTLNESRDALKRASHEQPVPVVQAPWVEVDWVAFQNEVRRDLGIGPMKQV